LRVEPKDGQRRRGCVQTKHLLGVAFACQGERVEDRERQPAEHILPLLDFLETRVGDPGANDVLLSVRRTQADQAVRFAVGERPQEDGIHDTEERHIGADAQRQTQHGHRREARRFEQLAEGVTDGLEHVTHSRRLDGEVAATGS
jgi:hypothetical protein